MQLTLVLWASAAGAIVVGLLLGVLVGRLVQRRLRKSAALTMIQANEIAIAAVRPLIVWWFTIAGLFAARLILSDVVPPRFERIVDALLLALLIGSITVALARVATDGLKLYALRSGTARSSSSLLVTLMRILIFLIGVLVLLQSLGVRITPLLGALGVGGIAVALALQPTLSNVFSGIQLLASGTVRPGDFVELEERRGFVEDINWRYTTIRQLPNNLTVIPNSVLSESVFTNYSLPASEMSLVIEGSVAYGSDLERVEAVAIEVGREAMSAQPETVPDFEPFVRFRSFADSGIVFSIILRVPTFTDQYLLQHEFVKRLHERFGREGIEIPFPQRVVHLEQSENDSRSAVDSGRGSDQPDR